MPDTIKEMDDARQEVAEVGEELTSCRYADEGVCVIPPDAQFCAACVAEDFPEDDNFCPCAELADYGDDLNPAEDEGLCFEVD